MYKLVPDTERQASHICRGYNYQAYQTILAWLKCAENEEILTEFAEDVDLVRRDAQRKITYAELSQIKNEKKRLTLNSKSAKELINNFFRHRNRNPNIVLFARLCTVSDRSRERNFDWVYADNGLDLWDLIKSRKLSAIDQKTAIEKLKSFYLNKRVLSRNVLDFIEGSIDDVFLSDFVDCISWDTGQSSYVDIEKDIKEILAGLPRPINDPLEIDQVIYRLWYFVTHSIAGNPGKALNKKDLQVILSEETTARIDRESFKGLVADGKRTIAGVENLEKMVSVLFEQATKQTEDAVPVRIIEQQTYQSNLPPLPTPWADRNEQITKIQEELKSKGFLWIQGSTGYGKTTLASLYARRKSSIGMWFRLGNYSDFTLISALHKIYLNIQTKLLEGDIVVLDDLSNIERQTYAIELLHYIYDYAKNISAELIITSQYRLPSRLKLHIGDGTLEYVAPEMSEKDIKLLLNRFGLDDDELIRFWSTYTYASTSGHPQLVGAFLLYAKENRWVFTVEMLKQQPRSVNEVKAEARKLLADTIRNFEAREIARYLSLITSPFDREFALNIGNAAPGLKEPGGALDALVGPWIESLGNDIYSLSPLLRGYAEVDVGKDGIGKYFVVICIAWLKKRTLTPFELVQAMVAALKVKFDPLIAKLCKIQFTTSAEDFINISKEIFLISHLYVESEDQLTEILPMTRFMFRYFQLKISENNEDWKLYLKIYFQIQKEIRELDVGSLEYKMCTWMFYIDTIIRTNTPIPAKTRVLQAITIIEMVQNNDIAEMTSLIDSDKMRIDTLLMIAAQNIDSFYDLEFLLSELKNRSDELVTSFFSGFEIYPDNLSLLIDRVWLNESKKDYPEWNKCIEVFYEAMKIAKQHNNHWLLVGAARGIIVIYDEYLDDRTKAFQVIEKAKSLLHISHPLLDLQEATVRYRADQYEKVIEIITNLESGLMHEILAVHRAYALRRAIISADKLKQRNKVRYFAECGLKISPNIIVEGLGELAPICFEAELGWCSHEEGNFDDAVNRFESVLSKMEKFSDQGYPLFKIFQLRFGSALGWLSHTWKMNNTVIHLKTTITKPFAGMFANFEDLPKEAENHTVQAYPLLWAHLGSYSASFTEMTFVDSIAKRALICSDGKQFILALIEINQAIYLNSIVNMDYNKAFFAGFEYAKLFALFIENRSSMGNHWNLKEPININNYFQSLNPGFLEKWSDNLTTFILEPMTIYICSLENQPNIDYFKWIEILTNTFGKEHRSIRFVKWMEKVISVGFGSSDAIEIIKKDAWGLSAESDQTRRLSIIAMCVSPSISLSENMSAQFSLLKNMMLPVIESTHWPIFYFKMVAKRWNYLASRQKFLIRFPLKWSEKILDAISAASPSAADIAKLLLLVGEATGIEWPSKMLFELRETSREINSLHG